MLKKEILLENEFIRKMPSREFGPAFNFRLGVWTVKWVSGIVFMCAVVMVDKAMAPCGLRTSIGYHHLLFCYESETFELFLVYLCVFRFPSPGSQTK